MPFLKETRHKIIICERIESKCAELHKQLQERLKAKPPKLEACSSVEFIEKHDVEKAGDEEGRNQLLSSIRFGCLCAGGHSECGNSIQILLEKNIPIILFEREGDLSAVRSPMLRVFKKSTIDDTELRKLIFSVKEDSQIAGAIRWAAEFYPYLHDNIENRFTKDSDLKDDIVTKIVDAVSYSVPKKP